MYSSTKLAPKYGAQFCKFCGWIGGFALFIKNGHLANPSLFLFIEHVVYGSPPKDTDCRTIPELNAANFMNDLKIIKNINSIKNATIEEIMANEELYVIPKPQVCINLGTTERVVCVNVNENEALPEITKVCNYLSRICTGYPDADCNK